MIVRKITIEFYQEADNQVGSEHAEITINPVLIDLWNKDKPEHYYTFKSEDGFSFDDEIELMKLFNKAKEMVNIAKT